MEVISLAKFERLHEQRALEALNRIVAIHDQLRPQLITGATGCNEQEAMAFLLLLSHKGILRPLLAVYHKRDDVYPLPVILYHELFLGPPKIPMTCDICGNEIQNEDELTFEIVFEVVGRVLFMA